MKELNPTLWRTCRVLAHPARIDLIRELFSNGPSTVADLAFKTHLTKGLGSAYLRSINARGLIRALPKGRYVFYSSEPNSTVQHAVEVLTALKNACNSGLNNECIIQCTTAFTHPRRIEIVAALQHKTRSAAELAGATGISMPALLRHLAKLKKRGIVEISKDCYRLVIPDNTFAHTLLLIALKCK